MRTVHEHAVDRTPPLPPVGVDLETTTVRCKLVHARSALAEGKQNNARTPKHRRRTSIVDHVRILPRRKVSSRITKKNSALRQVCGEWWPRELPGKIVPNPE